VPAAGDPLLAGLPDAVDLGQTFWLLLDDLNILRPRREPAVLPTGLVLRNQDFSRLPFPAVVLQHGCELIKRLIAEVTTWLSLQPLYWLGYSLRASSCEASIAESSNLRCATFDGNRVGALRLS